MKTISTITASILAALLLNGCASHQNDRYSISSSRLASGDTYTADQALDTNESQSGVDDKMTGFQSLQSLELTRSTLKNQQDAAMRLPDSDSVSFAADKMPTEQFIHAVLGDVLKLNYVITDGINTLSQPQSLNLQQSVSSRQLYLLSAQLLDASDINISVRDGTFFVHPKAKTNAATVLGIGRDYQDVPQVVGQVMQIVPIKYGMNISLERTLRELINGKITPDFEKNMLFITAERSEVLRALDLIQLLDMPASRGRNVGILRLTYITAEEFIEQVSRLLASEGIPAESSNNPKTNVAMVALEQIGAVALFGTEQFYLDRVNYWARQLDKPSEGAQKRYYIFHPRFARASDLGVSIAPLIGQPVGGDNRQGNQNRDTASAFNNGSPAAAQGGSEARAAKSAAITVSNEDITMTVDERSNTIIFYTSGIQYQTLLPMIRRLDIMPKQILLEATIAEVTLTDEFAQGFEFAFRSGRLSGGTKGALGAGDMGGFQLNWGDGVGQVLARLSASTSLINVLSNPTLVVRDGVSANITVGNEIPTVGSTTINPGTETQSTTIVRRKTGVSLTVTPTINAQGLVVMEIDQSISNVSDSGPQLDGATSIFERSVKTEVLAQSGQTILLGGLISENTTEGSSHVPGLASIPLLGNLFKGRNEKKEKTELVIFITPRVIENNEQWQLIRNKLNTGLQNLKLLD